MRAYRHRALNTARRRTSRFWRRWWRRRDGESQIAGPGAITDCVPFVLGILAGLRLRSLLGIGTRYPRSGRARVAVFRCLVIHERARSAFCETFGGGAAFCGFARDNFVCRKGPEARAVLDLEGAALESELSQAGREGGVCLSDGIAQLRAQVAGAPDLEEFVSLLVLYVEEKEGVDLVLGRVGVKFERYFVVAAIATPLK